MKVKVGDRFKVVDDSLPNLHGKEVLVYTNDTNVNDEALVYVYDLSGCPWSVPYKNLEAIENPVIVDHEETNNKLDVVTLTALRSAGFYADDIIKLREAEII